MKTRNLSTYLVIGVLLFFCGISVFKGTSVSHNLEETAMPGRNLWLIGKGEYFTDTLSKPYNHIVTDFTLVELLPRLENQVIVDGYENGKRYVDIHVENDTLYVDRLLRDSDTSIVRVNGDYALRVQIGAEGVQSISLNKGGKLSIPANPYGSDLQGKQVYKPEVWDQYVLRADELDLYLNGYAESRIFTEVKKLNIHRENNVTENSKTTMTTFNNGTITSISSAFVRASSNLSLNGSSEHLTVIDPRGAININGKSLKTDSLTFISNTSEDGYDTGSVSVQCSDYLHADLRYNTDIFYVGAPEIKTSARGYGRVIKKKSFGN